MKSEIEIKINEHDSITDPNVQRISVSFQPSKKENEDHLMSLESFKLELTSDDDILLPTNRWKALVEILKILSQVTVDLQANKENEQAICINIPENQDVLKMMALLKDALTILLPQPVFLQYDLKANQVLISP